MKSVRTITNAVRLGLFLVALPLLLAVGPESCVIDVECGDVLDIDHGQYRLSGDLECPWNSSRAAVTITGESVHFNLNGYTISDTSGFLLEGILVRGAYPHIRNGSIVDINCAGRHPDPAGNCAGIRLGEAPGARIIGMSLHNNSAGIISFSSVDVVGNADGARIHGNDITGNLRLGIGLFGTAEAAKITDNDLSDTGGMRGSPLGNGLGYLGSSEGVSLIGNVANNCTAAGIALYADERATAERNTIRDNTTLDNGVTGIAMSAFTEEFRPRDNLIQSNTSYGNGTADLREAIPLEAPFADCLNTWHDNDFDVAEPDCIE